MPTRYTHSTCLAFGTDGEPDYCELDVTVSYAVAWGSPETGAGYMADPYKYDPGSPDEVEDIRLELVDGRPITGCEFIEPVLSRFEEDDDLRAAMLEEARQREAAWVE